MKIKVDNFDEASLKVSDQQPYPMLHELRAITKRLLESQRPRQEGEEPAAETVEVVTDVLAKQLKKLVESPYFDMNPVYLQHTKDIFNAIAGRLEDWRNILEADKARRAANQGEDSEIEHLFYLLRGAALISWQTSQYEWADNTNILNDIIRETDDLRILTFAFRVKNNVGGSSQRVADIFDKVTFVSNAQNLLRSPSDHFTLTDIARGNNKNGEDILRGDFIFEIDRTGSNQSEKPSLEKVIVSRERILSPDKLPSQLAEELYNEQFKGVAENSRIKAKLEAKILWFRSCSIPDIAKNPLKYLLKLIQTTYQQRQYVPKEFAEQITEPFYTQIRDYVTEETDKDAVIQAINSICVLYKGRAENSTGFDPFLDLPQVSGDSSEEQRSWLLKALTDIASIKLDPQTGMKVAKLDLLKETYVKSSYFQWCFLRMFRHIIFNISSKQAVLSLETNQIITQLFKMINVDEIQAVQQIEGEEIKEAEMPVLWLHTKVAGEAIHLVKNLAKPRHEDQLELISKYEKRLVFEINTLNRKMLSAADGEDLSQEIQLQERVELCKWCLTHLHELSIRDQIGNITRKINESKIPSLFLKLKDQQDPVILDILIPSFFLVIGQLCNNLPGSIPQLIRSGVIPAIFEVVNRGLPETDSSFHTFLFCLSQVIIHDEGRQLAASSDVFQNIIRQVVEKVKFFDLGPSSSTQFHARQYLKSIVERDPQYKEKLNKLVEEFIMKGTEFAKELRSRYFNIAKQSSKSIKDRSDEISVAVKKSEEYKRLALIHRMITNFAGGHDQEFEGRNQDLRWTNGIITPEIFGNLMQLHDLIGQNPSLSDLSIRFAKSFKPLLEANNFPQNVEKFIDQWHKILRVCEQALGGLSFSKCKTLPLDLKEEDEKMDGNDSTCFVGMLNSFLVHNLTFQQMHSASISSIGQRDKVKDLISAVLDLSMLLSKAKVAFKIQELQDFIARPKADEKEELDRKELQMTRKEYLEMPFAGQGREEIQNNIIKKFELGTPQFLQMKIPMISEQLVTTKDSLTKFSQVQFQMHRPGRDNAQVRENQEKNQKFVGQQALKLVKALIRQCDKIGDDYSSPQTQYHVLMVLNILDLMSSLVSKGWFSAIACYEIHANGGLKGLLNAFNTITRKIQAVNSDTILLSFWNHLESVARRFSNFIIHHIIEDDKNQRADSRLSEIFLQSLFQWKMDPPFENVKQFAQSICHTLCTELLITPGDANPLLQSGDKPGLNHIVEVSMQLLTACSKQFQNCLTLKIAFGNNYRHMENREDRIGRGRAPPPNPRHVQQILDMGFGYSRDQIIQALQQNRDDVNRAMDFLLTQQPAGLLNDPFAQILDAIDNQNQAAAMQAVNQMEAEEEDVDMELIQAYQDSVFLQEEQQQSIAQPSKPSLPPIKLQKPAKITEEEIQELIKKVLHSGFDWLTEAFDSLPDATRSQTVLLEIMKNWKSDGVNQSKDMKRMYAKVDEIFKNKLQSKVHYEIEQASKKLQGDVIMVEEGKDQYLDACSAIHKACQFLRLIQRLIISQKAYLKEAISSDTPALCTKQIKLVMDYLTKNEAFKDQKTSINKCLQNLLHSYLFILFTLAHIQQATISVQLSELNRKNQATTEKITFLKNKYSQRLPPQMFMIKCNEIIENCLAGLLKPQLMVTAFNLAFRLVLDKNTITIDYSQNFIQAIFTKLNEVMQNKTLAKALDHNLINSIAILFFEKDPIIQAQLDKFISRVLYTKYEYQIEGPKKDQFKDKPAHTLTKVNLNNFLGFFKHLSIINQDMFKKMLGESCEITSTKANGKVSQENATISLKETVYSEIKKTISKERGIFKQAQKLIDYQSDKQIKTQIQQAKKTLIGQISEEVKNNFQAFLSSLQTSSNQQLEDFDAYIQSQIDGSPLIIPKEQVSDFISPNNGQILEMLAKLCQAYPAYTVIMMPQKPAQQIVTSKKQQNFIQWYIKNFLVSQMLIRVTASAPKASDEEEKEGAKEMIQVVSYTLKPVETMKLLEDHVVRFLNRLTSYNHMMTLNEQLVKHQLRSKFIMEALSLLSKKLKEKSQAKTNILKQKATILACLSVVEALINPKSPAVKSLNIGQDNFVNSLRLCIVRDSSSTTDLPPSLIKIVDDLLTDYVDVSNVQGNNSDLISKAVTLLKTMSEFISTEKRKEELAQERSLILEEIKEQAIEVLGDQIMPLDAHLVHEEGELMQNEEIESEDENENEDHPDQQIDPHQINDDEEEDDEDAPDDDEDEEDNEEDDDEMIDGQNDIEIIEDEYDEEGVDDDEDEDLNVLPHIIERRRGPGAGNDIINLNLNQQPERYHHQQMIFGRPPVPERIGRGPAGAQGPDWSQEEAEVQRILGNFRNNMPEVPAAQAIHHHDLGLDFPAFMAGRRDHADRQRQQDDGSKKGLIEQTFEDLRLISDQDLYTQVLNQQQSLDREVVQILAGVNQNNQGQANVNPQQQPRGGLGGGFERFGGNPFWARNPIVDELDDDEFHPRWPGIGGHLDLFNDLGGGGRILDMLQNEHDILNRLIIDQGLFPRIGGERYVPPGGRRPAAGAQANEIDPNLENGQFLQQIRQQVNIASQNIGGVTVDQLGQQLLQTVPVQIEEEKKDEQKPPEQQRRSSVIQQQQQLPGQQSLDDLFASMLGNPGGQQPGGAQQQNQMAADRPQQQSLNDFFARVAFGDQPVQQQQQQPLNGQQPDRPSSPMLIQQNLVLPAEQIQQPVLDQMEEVPLQEQDAELVAQNLSVDNMQIPEEGVAQIIQQLDNVQIPLIDQHEPSQQQQPVVAQEEQKSEENSVVNNNEVASSFNQEEVKQEQENQQVQVEQSEVVQNEQVPSEQQQEANEQVQNQAEQPQPVSTDPPGTTFGYDNELLLAFDIDPAILLELPEEMRNELLSSIGLPPPRQQQQQQQQQPSQQQQPAAQNQEGQEEAKQEAQIQPAQAQAQEPEYYAIARELGYDPEFLANLPEDMRNELLAQAQQERQPPAARRGPEQLDVPTLLATVTDINLRREIFMNMDEATLASLPAPLMAEGRQVQEFRERRLRDQAQIEQRIQERMRDHLGGNEDEIGGGIAGIHGRRRREEIERLARQQQQQLPNADKNIEEVVNIRMRVIAAETSKDDLIASLNTQLVQDEKIIEAFITILITNDKIQCDLIPCLQFLLKVQNSNGVPVIRNKVVNLITFLLKNLATNNDQIIVDLGFKTGEIKKKHAILILIGTLRLLLKSNKSLMKYILKGLISRDESQSKGPGSQMLRKQLKAIGYKQPVAEESANHNTEEMVDTSSKKTSKEKPFSIPSPLADIFSLIKVDYFKQEKMLMKNLTLLIHQILKNFDIARQELEQSQQQISQETIQTIAEVLSLENIDSHMMEDLGDFLFKISKQKKTNFALISDYCSKKSSNLIDKLSKKLNEFTFTFEDIKGRISPSKKLGLNSREMSQISNNEEEKGDFMINTSSFAIGGSLMRESSLAPSQSKGKQIKLEEDDEKQLRQLLRVYDDSEILYRIFKLFNLFYDKFNTDKDGKKVPEGEAIPLEDETTKEVVQFVKSTYESDDLKVFVSTVSDVLKIVFKTDMDMSEGVSNLIFCVISSFYPELFDSIRVEEEQKAKEKKELEEKKGDKTKYHVKMIPLLVTGPGHFSKEKYSLFRNQYYFTNRVEELSKFCIENKRIINKMIKSKPNLFVNELEGLIRHMPNLLDFDNKRTYFKKELSKHKRNNLYGDQIQLFIRRDDIFHDAFTQIRDKTANEMKGRLHISFTGERGQDAGGLTRDFFIELSREMFNPNYSLFILSSSGSTYYPNPKSHVEVQHLSYFKFIGRMVGKAIFDECLLECYFVKSLYKIMTGEPLNFSDLEDFDNEFYNNMKWCLENDVNCLMTTFVAETDYFGKPLEVELMENGKNIAVTNDNKKEFVEKLCYFKLYSEIQKQVDNFLEGFYELIPKELVSIFNYKELELLISGLPNFDLNDLKNNTEFSGYNSTSQQVLWLWEVLEILDSSERAEFLQFVTGSSKVPLDGFKGLIGMRGPQKFTIAKIKTDDFMRLPTGHTCFNQIDLPEYPSKEILHERLLLAIKETKGFGFA